MTATLLIQCQDQAGIVQAVSGFIYRYGGNIIALDQYTTAHEGGEYFMRLEFALSSESAGLGNFASIFDHIIADRYQMDWQVYDNSERAKVGILVSKYDHALLELLWRQQQGLLDCDINCVVSNHTDLQAAVESFNIPFYHVPINKDSDKNKAQAEKQMLELTKDCDLLILARYMQILSEDFIEHFPDKIINIHHSFLPAFIGADPYRQAFEKGVKLIGATAHYVTKDLDEGPIIAQDVKSVTHRQNVAQLKVIGKQIERDVLATAVNWHLQHRIIVTGNKTVVFNEY